MTRIGEILDILGADKTRSMGAYLETLFRYGDNPTSVVAKLRMFSERMQVMKEKEVEKSVKDIQETIAHSELPKIAQFGTLMTAEGYAKRKEFERAINLLVKYYQANPTTADTQLLNNRIGKNINENLHEMVDRGQCIEALKLHNKYADNWLKSSNRIDTKYNVGRAFEQAGVYSQANHLYKETLNKIYALKGTKAGQERNIFEKLPSEEELSLRLAAVENQQAQYADAYQTLNNIKHPEKLKETEQVERVQLAAALLERRGETDTAIRYLTELLKEWSGLPELVADPYLSLAQLDIKQNKTDDAIQALTKVNTLMEDSQKVSPQTHAKSLQLLGELQEKKGQSEEAIKTFEKLLSLYETSQPLSSYRYKVGQMYFKKGEINKAAEVWNELKSQKKDFWYQLAQEQLKGSEWKDEYKKYIQRIPAMSEPAKPAERK